MKTTPINAEAIDAVRGKTIYPQPYAALVQGRLKRKLGEAFGLCNFGVNMTELLPGAISALAHCHSKQEEFIFVLSGILTLKLGDEEFTLNAGDCFGFKAGTGLAHQLLNKSAAPVTYIEIGDRTEGDVVEYPHDDLRISQHINGHWALTRKDGRPYLQTP